MKPYWSLILVLLLAFSQSLGAQHVQKQRVIILTDIEADPDDTMSLVRLLLYSGEIDIKGLVATTSCWKRTSVAPDSIKKVIQAYGQVQPNLVKHEVGFPKADELLAVVKSGLPKYGMLGVGDGKDSQGSDWIIKVLEEKDDRPLWISVWGGVNTLAQSLHKIKATKSAAEAEKLIAKLRVYTISDQDDAGIWIRNNFPEVFYIVNPGDHYGSATWSAINMVVKGINNDEISNEWLAKNIQQGHGPLGSAYPDVAWGMEGDTPSYLSLIPNGLNNPEHPNWGGWGGRYELYKPELNPLKHGDSGVPHEPETRKIWTSAVDKYSPYIFQDYGRAVGKSPVSFEDNKVTLWRWRADFQNDFAARMDWCLKPYREANHPPVPAISGPEEINVKSGEGIGLDASGSTDPDGDSLSFLWFIYPEAGSYKGEIKIQPENAHGVYFTAPEVAEKETIHLILKVTDKGSPPLSRYKRVIVNVLPTSAVRPRVIIMSDFPPLDVIPGGAGIGPAEKRSDPDDVQSMVRFLLYADEFDVEGLVASAGTFANIARKQNILDILSLYERVYPNLVKHDSRFPTADKLRLVTWQGRDDTWGKDAQKIIGEGKDSEASDAIIKVVDSPDPRPVWICVWGGPREVAQAVWKVQQTRSPAEVDRFISKLRIYMIGLDNKPGQDGSGQWLLDNFPNLFVIVAQKTYWGMFAQKSPLGNLDWLNANIREGHGPLGAAYPRSGFNPNTPGQQEGDTPSFLYLASAGRGINNPEDPTQPSWGGQFMRPDAEKKHWYDGPGPDSVAKWLPDMQADFARRANWMLP